MDFPKNTMHLQDISRSTQPSLDASSKMFSDEQYHANLNSETVPFMTRHSGSIPLGENSASGRLNQHPKEEHPRLQQHPKIFSSRATTPHHIRPESQPHTPTNSAFESRCSTPQRLIATSQDNTPSTGALWPPVEQLTPRVLKRKPSLLGRTVSKRQKGSESPSEFEVQEWTGDSPHYMRVAFTKGFSPYYQGAAEHNKLNSSDFSEYEAAKSQGLEGGFSFGPPPQSRFDQPEDSLLNTTQQPQNRAYAANEFRNINGQVDPTFCKPVVYPNPISDDRRNFNLGGIFSDNIQNGSGQHYTSERARFERAKTAAPQRLPTFRIGRAMNSRDAMFLSPPQASKSHPKCLQSPFQPRERLNDEHNTELRWSYSETIPGPICSCDRAQTLAPQTPIRHKISGEDNAILLQSQELARAESVLPADVDSDQESTPMGEALRRHRPQHENGLSVSLETPCYRVSDILPKESVFDKEGQTCDSPEPVKSRPTGFKPAPPDVINLVTPETMKPSNRSVPMKERITPARKPKQPDKKVNTKMPKAKTTPKKTPKKKADKPFEEDPVLIREKQAAELLIRREADVERRDIDEALFGEADRESEQDKEKRMQEKAKKEEERKAANLLRSKMKEAAEVAAEEKKRKLAEEEILRKEEEAREAERKRAKREIERRRDEEAQQRVLEERRIMAAEKIKADRERAERENAEREQQKRLDAEKAAGIKAQADELARMKAKLEEAKKQASSLNFKRNVPIEKDFSKKDTSPNQGVDMDEEAGEDEDSLFVSETAPRKRPVPTVLGPGSATDKAKTAAQIILSQAREHSGATAGAETSSKTKELMGARYAQKEIEKSQEPVAPRVELVRERLTPAKFAKKNAFVTKPKPNPDAGLAASTENDLSCSEASSLVPEESTSIFPQSTANAELEVVLDPIPLKAAKDALGQTLRPAAIAFQEEIRLISQLRREQLELDAIKKKEVAKKERTDKQKAERRKKDAEKAAEKKKQQLIADASKKGTTISEDNLKAQIKIFLAEKEKEYELRAEKRAQQEKSQNSDEALPVKTSTQAKAKQQNAAFGSNYDDDGDEELTMEQLLRKKNEDARRERKMANALERNSGFVNAAEKKTVDDLQSDSESDEDRFIEQINPGNGKIGEWRDSESGCESDADSDSEYNVLSSRRSTTSDNNTQTHSFNTATTSLYGGRARQLSSRIPINLLNSALTPNPSPRAPDSTVNVYKVMRERIKRGNSDDAVLIDLFGNLEEANQIVLEQVEKIRNSKLSFEAYHEEMHEGGLRWAQVVHNVTKEYATNIYVEMDTRMASTLADYDPDWFKSDILKTIYQVVLRKIATPTVSVQDTTDESEQTAPIPKWTSKNIAAYTNLEMANHEACETMCKLLKPPTPRLEWHEMYESAVHDLRAGLEIKNNAKECFTAEVDNSDREMAWVDCLHAEVFVEEMPLKGPLN